MNQLKAKITITCSTCGCEMKRTKTMKVKSTNESAAKNEASRKIEEWKTKLQGVNCKTCQSIINDLKV